MASTLPAGCAVKVLYMDIHVAVPYCDFAHLACDDDLSAGDRREVSERELCCICSFTILFKYYNVTRPTDVLFSSYKTSYLEHNVYIFGSDNTAETFASHSVTCGLIA